MQNIVQLILIFYHPDYTVGTWVSQVQSRIFGSRGLLPPVGNFRWCESPCPEELFQYSGKCSSFWMIPK